MKSQNYFKILITYSPFTLMLVLLSSCLLCTSTLTPDWSMIDNSIGGCWQVVGDEEGWLEMSAVITTRRIDDIGCDNHGDTWEQTIFSGAGTGMSFSEAGFGSVWVLDGWVWDARNRETEGVTSASIKIYDERDGSHVFGRVRHIFERTEWPSRIERLIITYGEGESEEGLDLVRCSLP